MDSVSRLKYLLPASVIFAAAVVGLLIPVASGGKPPWQAPPTSVVRLPTATPTATATFTPLPPVSPPTNTPAVTPTATATATPTPTATMQATPVVTVTVEITSVITPTAVVTAGETVTLTIAYESVRVRAGPDVTYPVIGSATTGDVFDVVGRNAENTWWQICCLAGKRVGWVFGELVTLSGDAQIVPVTEVPPPPTPASSS